MGIENVMNPVTNFFKRFHELSKSKGWWPQYEKAKTEQELKEAVEATFPEKLMLIVSEAAEALEDYRTGKMDLHYEGVNQKPCGFPSEIADIVIRCGDLYDAYRRVNPTAPELATMITIKHEFNMTRPFRHGGKKA